jgi:hypothetical protein
MAIWILRSDSASAIPLPVGNGSSFASPTSEILLGMAGNSKGFAACFRQHIQPRNASSLICSWGPLEVRQELHDVMTCAQLAST